MIMFKSDEEPTYCVLSWLVLRCV